MKKENKNGELQEKIDDSENRPATPERKLVVTGELLGKGRAGPGTYPDGESIYSRFVGLAEQRNGYFIVIPLSGVYNPKRGDGVIGRVSEIAISKWIIDINSPYDASLLLSEAVAEFVDLTKTDLTKYFNYDDLIFAEVSAVSRTKSIQLSMKDRRCRKLRGGRIIKVTPAKVPRIIGRKGSMVEMIKEITGTQIVVGQNGIVWVKGDNEDIATEAVILIEEKSHVSGLTDYIKKMLEKKMKNVKKSQSKTSRKTDDSENRPASSKSSDSQVEKEDMEESDKEESKEE